MRTTKQNRNLAKLAKYLLALPDSYQKFNMKVYYSVNNVSPRSTFPPQYGKDILLKDCNTVACAVGHGTVAGIPVGRNHKSWREYSLDSFTQDSLEDDWLFSGEWGSIDDTPQGAAKRIALLLDQGQTEAMKDIVGVVTEGNCDDCDDYDEHDYHKVEKEIYWAITTDVDLSILDREGDWNTD